MRQWSSRVARPNATAWPSRRPPAGAEHQILETLRIGFRVSHLKPGESKGWNTQAEIMPTLEGKEPQGALPRVLLVDDNEAMLMRAAGVLKASCTIVGAAMNGRAGIDAAATLLPDVIVLDVSMPGMNGFEVASSLREAGSTAALIFFTVHQEQDVVTAALAAGALCYVTKNRLSTDLEHAVHEAHAGRRFVSPLG